MPCQLGRAASEVPGSSVCVCRRWRSMGLAQAPSQRGVMGALPDADYLGVGHPFVAEPWRFGLLGVKLRVKSPQRLEYDAQESWSVKLHTVPHTTGGLAEVDCHCHDAHVVKCELRELPASATSRSCSGPWRRSPTVPLAAHWAIVSKQCFECYPARCQPSLPADPPGLVTARVSKYRASTYTPTGP
jgi:hypothetical protein